MKRQERIRSFWRRGEPFVWATSAMLTAILFMTLILVGVVTVNGLGYFWPDRLVELTLKDGSKLLGNVTGRSVAPDDHTRERLQLKIANRDLYGQDFRWLNVSEIQTQVRQADAVLLEREQHGPFVGYIVGLQLPSLSQPEVASTESNLWPQLLDAHKKLIERRKGAESLRAEMGKLGTEKEKLRRQQLRLEYEKVPPTDARYGVITQRTAAIDTRFESLNTELNTKLDELRRNNALMRTADGQTKPVEIISIVRATQPNQLGLAGKCAYALHKLGELLLDEPREANTEGGLMPAIFGTVLMVLLMSCFCIPLGVIAAIYLREYAREGPLVRMVRIAVNNLAGVPSIVYGVFGLGFFVYGIGGALDRLFYPELENTPVFGTGGILWASLTLALLTVPVVIVATEESLAAVPRGIREGSLALGATKFQTLVRILLPLASPGIMTGLILAMARAAGEVAPLMMVGVVKSAPALPLDGSFPFVHLDRKFMHLAFAIFDSGFQSPNVEAARPMVFVTTLLLLVIVICLSGVAIVLRNQMRKRYSTGAF